MAEPATENTDKPAEQKSTIKDITVDDYTFKADTDLIDDVEVLGMINQIENSQNPSAIIDFLKYLIGDEGYEALKAHFVKKDGKLRLTKLTQVYTAIFEAFDPKG